MGVYRLSKGGKVVADGGFKMWEQSAGHNIDFQGLIQNLQMSAQLFSAGLEMLESLLWRMSQLRA